jgi:hypothetical protein
VRQIASFYLHNVGFDYIWFDNNRFELLGVKSGVPEHTLCSAGNGSGKSTAIALVLSTLYPYRKKFLRTHKDQNFKFEDYFDGHYFRPGFVVIEFDAGPRDAQSKIHERFVVGQVVCLPQAKESDIFRRFFSFRVADGLTMKALINGVEGGIGQLRDIHSIADVKAWFGAMQAFSSQNAHAADFYWTDHQDKWMHRLQSALGIDQELVQLIWRFNKKEGGGEVKEATSFRGDHDFLRRFLDLCLNEEMSDALKSALEKDIKDLTNLPVYEDTLKVFVEMDERFAPFRQKAAELQKAQRDHAAEVALAMGFLEAVERARGRHEQAKIGHEAKQVAKQDESDRAEDDINDALARRRGLELFLMQVQVRNLETDYNLAMDKLGHAKAALQRAEARRTLKAIDDKRLELREVKAELALIQKELAAYEQAAKEAGGRYKAALDHEIELFSVQRDQAKKIVAGQDTARKKIDQRLVEITKQQRQSGQDKANLVALQTAAGQSRARLEHDEIIHKGEGGREALERIGNHVAEAEAASVSVISRKLDLTAELSGLNRTIGAFRADHGRNEQALAELRGRIVSAEGRARRLVTELHEAGIVDTSEADIESTLIQRKIDDLQDNLSERFGAIAIEKKALENDQTCISTYRVLGVDHNVAKVVGRCKHSGIQAKPYGEYLAGIFTQDAETARKIFMSDPARFSGVQVNDAGALSVAEAISDLELDRPVVISLPTDKPQNRTGENDHVVLQPAGHALYNTDAAVAYVEGIEGRLEENEKRFMALRTRQEQISTLATRHVEYLAEFGKRALRVLRAEEREQTAELTKLAARIAESDGKRIELESQIQALNQDEARRKELLSEVQMKQRRVMEFVQDHESRSLEVERKLEAIGSKLKQIETSEIRQRSFRERSERTSTIWSDRVAALQVQISPLVYRRDQIVYAQKMLYDGQSTDGLAQVYHGKVRTFEARQDGKVIDLGRTAQILHKAVSELEQEYAKTFGNLDEEEVRAIPHEGIELVSQEARAQVETCGAHLGEKRSAWDGAKGALRNQRKNWGDDGLEITDPSLPDDVGQDDVSAMIQEVKEEVSVATSCRDEAKRLAEEAKALADKEKGKAGAFNKAKEVIALALVGESGQVAMVEEPTAETAEEAARLITGQVTKFKADIDKLERATLKAYQNFIPFLEEGKVRKFAAVHCASMLDASREDAFECFVADAEEKARLIGDKIKMLLFSISEYDSKLERCAAALAGGVEQGLRLLSRATSVEVPKEVPVLGGQPILKISKLDRLRSKGAQVVPLTELLKRFIKDLAELVVSGGTLPTGQVLTADALYFVAKERNATFNVRILKAIPAVAQFKHVPIESYNSASGGEGLTSALMYYLLAANIRGQERGHHIQCGGALILDNPIGEANLPMLIKTQRELASSLGVQLIYFTGITDLDSTSEFLHNIVMRISRRRDARTGRRYMEVWWGETLKEAFGETG